MMSKTHETRESEMWSGAVSSPHRLREAGRATFPSAARKNYCTNAQANIHPALTRLQLAPRTQSSGVSHDDDGGRRGERGLKRHQQPKASNNRGHLKLNHMLPVRLHQCPQEGRPRWTSHRSTALRLCQRSVPH